ncbi:hypothetical protein G9272_25165 [Streptomyces asoensis]|uniref:Uncharacterized protein n=1 Tax=Streptomyces asoensis TaxID=249586 RepID=A0A6M4WUW6_9ACTN|nr:hypothetical protein [Streptomyces asoensis]QJT03165.1 hypothetical protein G9272_25165 [Streptomyces asoensis]
MDHSIQRNEPAKSRKHGTKISTEGYLGSRVVSFDGQSVGRVDFVFTGSGTESDVVSVAAVARHTRGPRKPSLWKLVPIHDAHIRPDGTISVPYGRGMILSGPELASAPADLSTEMANKIKAHFSDVHYAVDLRGSLPRKPLPASGAVKFKGGATRKDDRDSEESLISSPIPGDEAFWHSSEAAHWAQAAQLIGVGVQLSGHHNVLNEWEDDARTLLIPRLESLKRGDPWPQARIAFEKLGLLETFLSVREEPLARAGELSTIQSQLWEESYLNQNGVSSEAATALLYSGLLSPSELVRISSASQLSWLLDDLEGDMREHLIQGCRSDSHTVQMISASALGRHEEDHEVLQNFIDPQSNCDTAEPAHTSTIVHGTWAANGIWWRPEGDFFQFIKQHVSTDLYDGPGYFRWSAKWKKKERRGAGFKLEQWLAANVVPHPGTKIKEFDTVFAHSHGANVSLSAGLVGAKITFLVLLHPAIDRRSPREMQLILSNISGVLAFFPHFDLTVLADRSLRGFPKHDDKVTERQIPGWFKHDALLDPYTWHQNGLINDLNYYRDQARDRRRDLQI